MKGNMNNIVRQAQKMQSQIAKVQDEIAEKKVEASTGGGVVTAVAVVRGGHTDEDFGITARLNRLIDRARGSAVGFGIEYRLALALADFASEHPLVVDVHFYGRDLPPLFGRKFVVEGQRHRVGIAQFRRTGRSLALVDAV